MLLIPCFPEDAHKWSSGASSSSTHIKIMGCIQALIYALANQSMTLETLPCLVMTLDRSQHTLQGVQVGFKANSQRSFSGPPHHNDNIYFFKAE